ncbi:SprT-like domain-containing protein [Rozella allomycis CSF55]|uniref:SprT-like domain-containing protein n=1 Tax=Rozella allomycis (strain CSF55) TaxID=988480 RepID=A0A075AZ15_ROZAC|nr:SprT-like domain-containing protein [Rozella allomycis CSF55]|eukprot:EPZ33799.1 SprT-like domain-containing protein [Rozella allomycis CSF55]
MDFMDPNPNIHDLFMQFNRKIFDNKLCSVEVKWSKRMTLCAGICVYQPRSKYCCIKLSEPLLKFRTRRDLVDTLLHEMIHAFLFVTENNTDHDGHGPNFQFLMNDINRKENTSISIYHNFRDEVSFYRTHIWRCNGKCRAMPPFYGYVKRSMNRKPQPADYWWKEHERTCGGEFQKISEPEKIKKVPKNVKKERARAKVKGDKTLDKFIHHTNKKSAPEIIEILSSDSDISGQKEDNNFIIID